MSMLTVRLGALEYLVSDRMPEGFRHGFSTRFGGVSGGMWSSLNLGTHRGDDPASVWENYRIFGQAVGFSPEQTVFTRQLHGSIVRSVTKKDCGTGLLREQTEECDGIVTDEPGVALVAFGADCPTILLADPVRRVACAVHAGWRGTALGIAREAVRRMGDYGSKPENITAAIGPCIGPCCFETHADVPDAMLAAFGEDVRSCILPAPTEGKFFVDLRGINAWLLRECGVPFTDVTPDCTACQPERFWSHRRVGGNRGSQASVILIESATESKIYDGF